MQTFEYFNVFMICEFFFRKLIKSYVQEDLLDTYITFESMHEIQRWFVRE